MTTTSSAEPTLLARWFDVSSPSGAVWLTGDDGESHCVPYSHLKSAVAAGDYSNPIFRPAICTDIPFEAHGLLPDREPSRRPCSKCARLLQLGHWHRLPQWPIWDDILEPGRAVMGEVWSGDNGATSGDAAAEFIALCRAGIDWKAALSRCGARSMVELGRKSSRVQSAAIMALVPPQQHKSFRRGLHEATSGA